MRRFAPRVDQGRDNLRKQSTEHLGQAVEQALRGIRYTVEELEKRLLLSVATPDPEWGEATPIDNAYSTGSASAYLPGEVLVKFRKDVAVPGLGSKGASAADLSLDKLLRSLGADSIEPVFRAIGTKGASIAGPDGMDRAELSQWYHLSLPRDADVQQAVARLETSPDVEFAEPNYQLRLADFIPEPVEGIPNGFSDPGYEEQWYHAAAKVEKAWVYLGQNGIFPGGKRDVVVAVIDSGVDSTHEDLAGNMWTNASEIPGNGIDDDSNGFVDDIHGASLVSDPRSHSGDSSDLGGHGTHVAGIVASQGFNHLGGVGVAFNVQIMSVRAAQYAGVLTTQDITEAIIYAIDNGADVINMSFGGYGKSQMMLDALEVALSTTVLVAAAGNSSGPQMYPAAFPFVLGVGASTEKGKRAWFSNESDIMAPGVDIYSTLPGNRYAKWSGTSMAAPVVSGVAALMRSYFWQRDIYSSRFIMGSILESGGVVDAYRALTEPPKPGVSVLDTWLFDDKTISPRNDDDGRVDSGETVHLAVELMNRSGQADEVLAVLEPIREGALWADPYVTMNVSQISFGGIGPFNSADNGFIYNNEGVITGVERPFVFTVAADTPNEHIIPFRMTTYFRDGWDPEHPMYKRVSYFQYIVQRGKNVPRVIAQGEHVELTADDYWIVGSPVLVEAGATLSIRPGTQVQWGAVSDDPYNPGPQGGSILVRGTLEIEGTEEKPVDLFPSYMVYGQRVSIKVESGRAEMRYVRVRNPDLVGIANVDHGYFNWDMYNSTVSVSDTISNSIFHRLRGGGDLAAARLDTVLLDAGWMGASSGSVVNSVYLQDNENNRTLGVYFPVTTRAEQIGTISQLNTIQHDGKTYVTLVQPGGGMPGGGTYRASLQMAELVANYFGGHTASINDAAEQKFLSEWLLSLFGGAQFAVGMTDEGQPGQYRWLDGSEVTYTNWDAGYPTAHLISNRQLVALNWGSESDPGSVRWRNVPEQAWEPVNSPHGMVLELPGQWSAEQIISAIDNKALLAHVRQNLLGELRYNAFLSKYWEPNIARWMSFASQGNASDAYASAHGNYWGTTSTTLLDYAISDYYDNFTSARLDYKPVAMHGVESTFPFVESVLINGIPADSVPEVSTGPATFTISFNRDMDTSVQPFVSFGPSTPHTDFLVHPIGSNVIEFAANKAVFNVRLSQPADREVTVAYATQDGTAIGGVDYQPASGTVTFAPGQTLTTISVYLLGNEVLEGNRVFSLKLSEPTVAGLSDDSATGLITDDDAVFSISDATIVEGDSGDEDAVFVVSLSSPLTRTVTVEYATQNGTAWVGFDYRPRTGTLTFEPGQTQQTILVPIVGERRSEPDETFTVRLGYPTMANIADRDGLGTILNDDPIVSIGDASVVEGNQGTVSAGFVVRLSGPSPRTRTVSYATRDGTALGGVDYVPASGTLVFEPGQTEKIVSVSVLDDVLDEPAELFYVDLAAPADMEIADASGAGTIVGDDGNLLVSSGAFQEGNGQGGAMAFTVSLKSPVDRDVTVYYTTSDGTATAGTDYVATSGTLTIPAGQTEATLSVPLLADFEPESDETFTVHVTDLWMQFAERTEFPSGGGPAATGDINGDGLPDLLVLHDGPAAGILLNKTAVGSLVPDFAARQSFDVGPSPAAPVLADFDGDGRLDLAVANSTEATITVRLNTTPAGSTTVSFGPKLVFNTGNGPGEMMAADMNLDGRMDLVLVTVFAGGLTVNLNCPAPGGGVDFSKTFWSPAGAPWLSGLAVGDLNSDGKPDMVVGTSYNETLSIYLNATPPGADFVQFCIRQNRSLGQPRSVSLADLNTDGRLDLVVYDNSAGMSTMLVNQTPAGSQVVAFAPRQPLPATTVASGDFNSDGRQDLWIFGSGSILPNATVPGTELLHFGPRQDLTTALGPPLRIADFNLDGKPDLAAMTASNNVAIMLNRTEIQRLDQPGIGTILDEDPAITIDDASVLEGDAGASQLAFVVRLSRQPAQTVTVKYATSNGTAAQGTDYTAASGTLTFGPGGPLAQTIFVAALGDTAFEGNETLTVKLFDASNAGIRDDAAEGVITNDDVEPIVGPGISVADVRLWESDSGQQQAVFLITLAEASPEVVSASYATAADTASADSDFKPISGVLTFAPGEIEKTIAVAVFGDSVDEMDEVFKLVLSGASHARLTDGEAVATILDDEPVVRVGDALVVEGNAGTVDAIFAVSISANPLHSVSVNYSTGNLTAAAGEDYAATSGTLIFEPGGQLTQTVVVPVMGDLLGEVNETFLLKLTGAAGAAIADDQGQGTIVGDDGLLLSVADTETIEGHSGTREAAFAVRISENPGQRVTVRYMTQNGQATSGKDYHPVAAQLVFDPGQPLEQIVYVPVIGDTANEPNEAFYVKLYDATVAAIADDLGVGTIRDDDPLLSIDDASIVEGHSGTQQVTITIRLSADPVVAVSVQYDTASGDAMQGTDFLAASGTLTFEPGGPLAQDITLRVLGDIDNEVHEAFLVNLSDATNAAIADEQGRVSILDDDGAKIVVSDLSVVEKDSEAVDAVFVVSLTEPASWPMTVDYATGDGTALAGGDYVAISGTLTFNPGGPLSQLVTVQIKGDLIDELGESFLLNLSNGVGVPILDAQGIATIEDNDQAMISIEDLIVEEGYNGWVNKRQWQGVQWITPVTGEGYQLIRVSGGVAASDKWLVSGYDVARFRFEVRTMGVAAMTLQASGQEGAIRLMWQQNDFDLLAGYNVYRADTVDGLYTRLNDTIIPVGQEYYVDSNVVPAVAKFYKFTVLLTDMTESAFSNVASAAAVDTVPPVIGHVPETSAAPGFGLRLSASVTDNVDVSVVTLHYRSLGGGGNYVSLAMTNASAVTWSATIPGSAVQPPGIEYYLVASDGISQTYDGTPVAPHNVVVQNQPTLASISPASGSIAGGKTVTLGGTLFQAGAQVLFGGVPASNVVVLSANQITCITPPHFPAQVEVTVINPDDSRATLLNGYRFEDQAVVLSLPTLAADAGAIIDVPIQLSNVSGLLAADLTITFNAAVLQAQSARTGPLGTGFALSPNLSAPGSVRLSLASATSVTGSGILAHITFRIVGAPTSQSPLTLASALLNDGAINGNLGSGSITVNGLFSLSGRIGYFSDNGPVRGTSLSLVGAGVHSSISGVEGQFTIPSVLTGAYTLTPSKADDVAEITAYDASLVLQSAAGLLSLSANQKLAADVNRNGSVSSMDASYILQKSVGLLETPFPNAGKVWDFVPGTRSYSLLNGDLAGQDFMAILIGDVSGNWQAPALPPKSAATPATLALPQLQSWTGNHILLPLTLSCNGAEVYSADLSLSYDPARLALEGVEVGSAAEGTLYAFNGGQAGLVRAAFASGQPLSSDGPLVQLRFQVIAPLQDPASVRIQAARLNEGRVPTLAQDGLVQDIAPPSLIEGGQDNDVIHLRLNPNRPEFLQIFRNTPLSGLPTYEMLASAVPGLTINTFGGDDQLSIGSPLPFAPLFNSGGNPLDTLSIAAGLHTFPAAALAGQPHVSLTGDALLNLSGQPRLSSLTLTDTAQAHLTPGASVLRLGDLSLSASCLLDLSDGSLIVQGEAPDAALTRLSGWIKDGRLAVGASTSPSVVGPAILLNSRNGRPMMSQFAGQTVDERAVLIKSTWHGDSDLNGRIDASDYFRINRGSAKGLAGYSNGDLDYSGSVDVGDYVLIDRAFLAQQQTKASPAPKALFATKPIPKHLAPRKPAKPRKPAPPKAKLPSASAHLKQAGAH